MSSVLQAELSRPDYADVRSHMDFAANACLVLAAYAMRYTGYMKDEHIAGLKFLTFGVSLPVVLCSVLWTAEFKASLLIVGGLSMLVHALIPLVVYVMYCRVKPNERRGYMAMATQGCGLPFSYQAILSTLGPEGLTAACLWEIGGNLWLVIIGNGIVASLFKPPADNYECKETLTEGTGEQPEVIGQTVRQRCESAPEFSSLGVPNPDNKQEPRPKLVPMSSHHNLSINAADLEAMANVLDGSSSVTGVSRQALRSAGAGKKCWQVLEPIFKLPLLWGVVAGIGLNVCQVPFHYMPIKVMHILAQCFPPLLYILLGSVLQFRLGREEYIIVLQALACRWLLLGSIAAAVWFSTLDKLVRGVVILCLATPVSTTFLIYAAEFGYNAQRIAMTYNISAVFSVLLIHVLNTCLVA